MPAANVMGGSVTPTHISRIDSLYRMKIRSAIFHVRARTSPAYRVSVSM